MADKDDEKDDQDEADAPKKKDGLGLPAIIAISVGFLILNVIIIFIGIQVFIVKKPIGELFGSGEKEPVIRYEDGDSSEPDERIVRRLGKIFRLENDIIINPADSKTRFAVLSMAFEFRSFEKLEPAEDTANPLSDTKAQVVIRDKVTRLIGSFTTDQLQSVQVQDSIKQTLKKDLQPYFEKDKILNIYFERFIIQ